MLRRAVTEISGRAVDEYRLRAGRLEVAVLSFGAITRDFQVDGRSVVLSYDDPAEYGDDPYFVGVIAGRVANRIAGGRFMLGGEEIVLPLNDGANHLHGGPRGLGKRHWSLDEDSAANAVRLRHVSGHGDGGYPGRAAFEVIVTLSDSALTYDMRAEVDRPTPISLAQHNYYTLTGGGIGDHSVTIAADRVLPRDASGIPTGGPQPVDGTRFDFRAGRRLDETDPAGAGIDYCLVLTGDTPAATLTAPGAPGLRFFTDQPALQLYTGGGLGDPFAPRSGLCLEPGGYTDAMNHAGFPTIVATPDAPYRQSLTIEVF